MHRPNGPILQPSFFAIMPLAKHSINFCDHECYYDNNLYKSALRVFLLELSISLSTATPHNHTATKFFSFDYDLW